MRTLAGRRVFLTGAASGIGRATAMAAAAEGADLFLTDLNAPSLADVSDEIRQAGGTVSYAEAADVADFSQVQGLAADIHAGFGSMDVVMNIAGVSAWGTVENLEHRQWTSMVDINLMGPIHVIESFLPAMIAARRGGHLVNVSSAAGLIGLPWHAAYSASKFGLRGISEVLRFDLRRHDIGVSLVCPGGVATPLTGTVEVAGIDQDSAEFATLRARFENRAVSPETAARAILRGVADNAYLVYTSNDIRLIHAVQRYAPPLYVLAMNVLNRRVNALLPAPGSSFPAP